MNTLQLPYRESPNLPPLCEPIAVLDNLVSGFLPVEPMEDDLYRLTGYTVQRSPSDGRPDRIVNTRIVLTLPALMRLSMALTQAIGVRS